MVQDQSCLNPCNGVSATVVGARCDFASAVSLCAPPNAATAEVPCCVIQNPAVEFGSGTRCKADIQVSTADGGMLPAGPLVKPAAEVGCKPQPVADSTPTEKANLLQGSFQVPEIRDCVPDTLARLTKSVNPTSVESPTGLGPNSPRLTVQAAADPLVIELFAGAARVTACLKQLGLASAAGVDVDCSKAVLTCLQADLSTCEGQRLCWEWLRSPRLAAIFAAPMCGTCSRARELDNWPPPLRDEMYPDGLPGLSASDALRVSTANAVYDFLSAVVEEAVSRGVICIKENPRNSIYWITSFFQRIRNFSGL